MLWKIDPQKSAKENLWDCIRLNTHSFKAKAIKGGLKLTVDEWSEVLDIVMFAAIRRFMYRLSNGKYNRDYSFYLNVRASVWAVFYSNVKQYVEKVVHTKMNSLDRLTIDQADHFMNTCPMPRYLSDKDESKRAREALKTWMKGSDFGQHVHKELAANYWELIESCEDNGLQVNKNALDYLLGKQYATGEKERVKMILIRDSIINDAVLGSLLVGGQKICETLENKNKLLPYGDYRLLVNKSPTFGRDLALIFNDKIKKSRGFRIHEGNRAINSSGCILVGMGRANDTITDSRKACDVVTEIARNDCTLKIVSNGMI